MLATALKDCLRCRYRCSFHVESRKHDFVAWGIGMPMMRVLDRNGTEREIDVDAGQTVMEALRDFDYGVLAICGGMCSCATCHVYVHPEWVNRLPTPMSDERELLSALAYVRPESRLSCQVALTDALEGLCVTVAPEE